MVWELVILVLLVLANGLLAGAEIAIVSIDKVRMKQLSEQGGRGVAAVRKLREAPERFFATVQIGITVIGASAAAFGGATFAQRLEPLIAELPYGRDHARALSLAVVVAGISYLSLVLGELVPKSLALRYGTKYSRWVAPLVSGLSVVARPLVWLLTGSSNLVLALFGDKTSFTEGRMSAAELAGLVGDATESGELHPTAGEIASRALEFVDVTVGQLMVPRNRVVGIPRNATGAEVMDIVLENGFSRLPVYGKDLDDVAGYILVKDMLSIAWERQLVVLEDLIRSPFFVSELASAPTVLKDMQARKVHLAIVVDEHGGTAGIVTMEDLLEELVGEITSELADDKTPTLAQRADGAWLVPGEVSLRELNRQLSTDISEEEGFTTVAGLCLTLAGRLPKAGESFSSPDGSRFEVVEVSERSVLKVAVWPSLPQP